METIVSFGKEFKNLHEIMMRNYIITYLGNHNLIELDNLIEQAIEQKAEWDIDHYSQEFINHLNKLSGETPKPNNIKIIHATDKEIKKLEDNCLMLRRLLKRTNLTHLERTALLFIYMQLGSKGEERLRQILQHQINYRENITNSQINQVKTKKRIGISCEKLIEWCTCNEKECKNYKKIEGL